MPDSEEKVETEQTGSEQVSEHQNDTEDELNSGESGEKNSGEEAEHAGENIGPELETLVQTDDRSAGESVTGAEIDMLMDVNVTVSIELGRTVQPIEEILKLAPGRIIELDRPAGENVDMYLNEKLFARGEVTVIDDNYAVRVTEIVKTK